MRWYVVVLLGFLMTACASTPPLIMKVEALGDNIDATHIVNKRLLDRKVKQVLIDGNMFILVFDNGQTIAVFPEEEQDEKGLVIPKDLIVEFNK